jgi:Domain of unknown function (DUF4136)
MPCCFRQLRNNVCVALGLACLLCCVTAAQTDEQGDEETQAYRTTHAPGVDFSKFHTYKWVEVKGEHPDPIVNAQIKQSIDSQLGAKGLRKVVDDTADLNVDYQTAMSNVETWQSYEDWTAPMMEQRLPHHKKVTIEMGTLVVDMYDTTVKQLVWTGRSHKTLDPNSSAKDRQKNLDKAVKKLLADFPPK